MLLESVFETLRRIENERLQLPIFYESPIALRFETGDPSLDIFLVKRTSIRSICGVPSGAFPFYMKKSRRLIRSFGYCIARRIWKQMSLPSSTASVR